MLAAVQRVYAGKVQMLLDDYLAAARAGAKDTKVRFSCKTSTPGYEQMSRKDPEELRDDPDFPGCKMLTSNYRTKYRDEAIYKVFGVTSKAEQDRQRRNQQTVLGQSPSGSSSSGSGSHVPTTVAVPPQAMGPATPLSDQNRTLVQQAIQDTMLETV